MNDRPLKRVIAPCTGSNVKSGSFCIDYDENKIYVSDDPTRRQVEYSKVSSALRGGVGVVVRSMAVNEYANPAEMGGAIQAGDNWLVDGVEMTHNHGCALELVGMVGTVVQNSYLHDNGDLGACGTSTGGVFQNNEVARNNVLGFDGNWQAGGAKFTQAVNLTVVGNYVHDNNGPGLWFDMDDTGVTVSDNVVTNNADTYGNGNGIMYEISCHGTITGNTTSGNGQAGVFVSNSHDVEVSANTVSDNLEYGVRVLADNRTGSQTHCGEEIHVFNVVVTTNKVTMPAGTSWTGVQQVGGGVADNNSFAGNDYVLTEATCTTANRWRWWDGSRSYTVPFSGSGTTWEGTFKQDLPPAGTCSSG
jgi:parallel beta-helix repeat protein